MRDWAISRRRETTSGRRFASFTLSRSSTAVETLAALVPPGPDERRNFHEIELAASAVLPTIKEDIVSWNSVSEFAYAPELEHL